MSERLEALKRWVTRSGTERVEVFLDEVSSARLKSLAQGRETPEVLSYLASHIIEDVLQAEDYERRVNEAADYPGVGDPAPDAEVMSASGESVRLSSRWADGPTALVFLRHYG
jgi:hypothetical protein